MPYYGIESKIGVGSSVIIGRVGFPFEEGTYMLLEEEMDERGETWGRIVLFKDGIADVQEILDSYRLMGSLGSFTGDAINSSNLRGRIRYYPQTNLQGKLMLADRVII